MRWTRMVSSHAQLAFAFSCSFLLSSLDAAPAIDCAAGDGQIDYEEFVALMTGRQGMLSRCQQWVAVNVVFFVSFPPLWALGCSLLPFTHLI